MITETYVVGHIPAGIDRRKGSVLGESTADRRCRVLAEFLQIACLRGARWIVFDEP
jgi:hypothetical protein